MMKSRCVLCFALGAIALVISPVVSQPIEIVELDNSRYFISNSYSGYARQFNWFLANQKCRSIGMQLLAISSQQKADTLTKFLNENSFYMGSDYWTSGNQLGDQQWIWMSTGQPFNFTWNTSPPSGPWPDYNGYDIYDYIGQSYGQSVNSVNSNSCMSQMNGIWSVHNCMDSKHYICEQNI